MYWCKKSFLFIIGFILLQNMLSCKTDSRAGTDTVKFFDLKGYFTAESARLTKLNPVINKTAVFNNYTQTKKLHIQNWSNELSSFIESDINKPAWRTSYNVQATDNLLIYRAKDSSLKTREIIIKKEGDKIKWILIFNHPKSKLVNKTLSETLEKLSYFPDSLYLIRRKQTVRLLGTNNYTVQGLFH